MSHTTVNEITSELECGSSPKPLMVEKGTIKYLKGYNAEVPIQKAFKTLRQFCENNNLSLEYMHGLVKNAIGGTGNWAIGWCRSEKGAKCFKEYWTHLLMHAEW